MNFTGRQIFIAIAKLAVCVTAASIVFIYIFRIDSLVSVALAGFMCFLALIAKSQEKKEDESDGSS